MSNYRPIANLSFISKLTEKIVKQRLLDHFTSNSLFNPFQSANTKFHSTEATLLSPHGHLFNVIYMQPVSCLCFLIYQLPLILLTTPTYSIVFPPCLSFPLFQYNVSLHNSHPAHLLQGSPQTFLLHPLLPVEFHKAPFSAQFSSIVVPLLLALSSVPILSLTSCVLTTHNSSYLLFLKMSHLP